MARPAYLNHIGTRSCATPRSDLPCTVVLRPQGRALLPTGAHQRLGLTQVPPDQDIELGAVAPHDRASLTRRRHGHPGSWVFLRPDHSGGPSTGRYDYRSEAIESCAVEAIDGPVARLRFDNQRWQRRRPSDN